ncbi:hypothetical protein [Lacipirellula sp.]|uniref:hypothetical protein n=1 Tax=Lacipirellula sp. TaxID=2691419 RepID=UPI003D1327D7
MLSKTAKRGASKKPPEELRGAPIQIRLTKAERQACEDAAAMAGMNLTVWARTELVKAAKRIAKP